MWKNKGDEGFERDIDNQFECAKYLAELVRQREGFELILEVNFSQFLSAFKDF
jgi:glutamate/tyrosine decarboxylase-like PLP-dependent enzyme